MFPSASAPSPQRSRLLNERLSGRLCLVRIPLLLPLTRHFFLRVLRGGIRLVILWRVSYIGRQFPKIYSSHIFPIQEERWYTHEESNPESLDISQLQRTASPWVHIKARILISCSLFLSQAPMFFTMAIRA